MIEKHINKHVKIVYNDLTKDKNYKAIFGILTEYDNDFVTVKQDNGVECILSKKQIVLVKENEK